MPWTFAHPAAILPLRKIGFLRLPLVALVVGSISPDIGYYLGLSGVASFSHTIPGIFLACLPMGAACLALLHLVRGPLLNLLPQPHRDVIRAAVEPEKTDPLRRYTTRIAALVAGAATHVLWDSFTHASGGMVRSFDFLRAHVFSIAGREFQVFNILQHLSSAFGVAVLLAMYGVRLRQMRPCPRPEATAADRRRYAVLAGCIVLSAATALLMAYLTGAKGSSFIFHTAVYAANAFVVCTVAAALIGEFGEFGKGR
jgi:hypothetical protein